MVTFHKGDHKGDPNIHVLTSKRVVGTSKLQKHWVFGDVHFKGYVAERSKHRHAPTCLANLWVSPQREAHFEGGKNRNFGEE